MSVVITRRGFAFGISALGGGLAMGLTPAPAHAAALPEITAWIVIHDDDTVIIRVARSEMGQGSFTALPMLVAEELECDWGRVHPEYADPAENLARGRPWGDMVTAASLSIRASHLYLRKAGAQARTMLIAEAASRWGAPPGECGARDSVVTHAATGRTWRFGELADAASRRAIPQDVVLKAPQDWRLIGTSVNRFGALDKATGQPIYASDVRLPGMLYAAVAACPARGGRLVSFDAGAVSAMPGVRQVIPVAGTAVAVLATSWWQAKKALDALPVVWDDSAVRWMSTDTLRQHYRDGLDAADTAFARRDGDVDAAMAGAASVITADYEVPYLAHVTMEPINCTAHVVDGRAEVWAPTQNGEGTLRTVARTLGIDPSQVIVHKHHLGGGFGRRGLAQDWAQMAVLIARQAGAPVKMIWSREEDVQHDVCRPSVMARQTAGFDAGGKLVGWKVRLCGSSISHNLAPDRLKNGQDWEMMSAFLDEDMVYGVPNFEVGYVMRNTTIPVGFWRGVNHTQNGFFREVFVDEMAHHAGEDPLAFRRRLLADSPRSLAVLDEVARRANWNEPGARPDGVHQGIAIVESYEAVCAFVIDVSVDPAGAVSVHRVVCALDCGYVVNPQIVVTQMEGAVAFGLSAALAGEITHRGGRVEQSNFHDYPVLRMNEVPPVETYLVPTGDRYSRKWGGVGEPGVPPVAPALINAVFAATERRVRSLPVKNNDLTRA